MGEKGQAQRVHSPVLLTEKTTTQFVTPFLKRFCYYNLAQVILILSVIHK